MNLRGLLDDLHTAATMPRVKVVLSRGEADEEATLRRFRSRHPRYKVVRLKAVGVALLPLDDITDVEDYLSTRRTARRGVRRASKLGYSARAFHADDRRAELLDVHSSLPERQGRPIDAEYLDPDARWETGPHIEYLGVFRDDVLVAYGKVEYAGDIAAIARVMGHGDHLRNGVMFLLTAEIVGHVRSVRPQTHYLLYDMFFGAGAGLREFKTHLGFRPHYVRWTRELSQAGDVAQR
jgi:hypothetical protein